MSTPLNTARPAPICLARYAPVEDRGELRTYTIVDDIKRQIASPHHSSLELTSMQDIAGRYDLQAADLELLSGISCKRKSLLKELKNWINYFLDVPWLDDVANIKDINFDSGRVNHQLNHFRDKLEGYVCPELKAWDHSVIRRSAGFWSEQARSIMQLITPEA